jgi:proprotein convertase subtilisin/kexin type 5
LIVYLPSEYTTNGIGCVPISNLSCTILTQQSLKVTSLTAVSAISFQLTNITNPVSSGYFTFDAYISGFLSGVNNNTVSYQSPCQLPCRACLSTNASACLDCMKVLITAFPILDPFRNMCVSACIDGYYNNQNICSICPPECKTCQSASNCTSCSASYNLFQNTCLTNCPDLYYPNNSICVACTPPCLSCVSSTLCKNCTQPYNLYTNQCLLQCPNTTISNSQLCVPCLGACQTCQGTLTNCTSCSSGNFRYNNTCVANCPNGYIVVGDACQLCIGCLTCISNQTTCTSCLSPNLLYNYSCISDCPAGYYS